MERIKIRSNVYFYGTILYESHEPRLPTLSLDCSYHNFSSLLRNAMEKNPRGGLK